MAALGAVIAFYFGLALIHPLLLPLMAVAGAIIALAPLMLLARRTESPLGLILAGLAISTLPGAGILLALNLALHPIPAMAILTWLPGPLAARLLGPLLIPHLCIAQGGVLLLWGGRGRQQRT